MADYQPLIGKAVAGLEKNTGETRRVLYERARRALVGQLRNMNPPLTESEITRERLALEEAIRKVEADAARRMRMDPARADAASAALRAEEQRRTNSAATAQVERESPQAAAARREAERGSAGETRADRPTPRTRGDREPVGEASLRGFRDVVAEAEMLGDKTAEGSRSARAAYTSVPAGTPEHDRAEPRMEPEGLRGPARQSRRMAEARQAERRAPPSARRGELEVERLRPPQRSRKGAVAALLTLLIIIGLGITAFYQRDRIASVFRAVAPQLQREATPQRPKISDRVGPEGQPTQSSPGPTTPQTPQVAAVAQRVVLYEEDPADPGGKRYLGSAIWRNETVGGSGGTPDVAIRCDVEIPERRLAMTMSIRRNIDPNLPASHTIEIMFNVPADFQFGGINNLSSILMKQAEQTRGVQLSGLVAKVTSGYFLIGLSATEADVQRNIELLKERSWFDIPVIYNNGRRAILAVEKGTPGERVFADAFAAWKQ